MKLSKGIQLALVSALLSGISIFVNKFAISAIQPPLLFTGTKNLIVGLLMISWLVGGGGWRGWKSLTKFDLGKLSTIALIGGTLPFYLFFTGLIQIPAANGAIIHKSLVIWVALMAWPLLKERLSTVQIWAIVLLFVSNLLIGGFGGFSWSTGEAMVLAATVLWAIETVVAKQVLMQVSPDLVATARMAGGSLVLMAAALWQYPQSVANIANMSLSQWGWLLATAATLSVYIMVWYRALQLEKAVTVTAVLVAATLVTNVLSAVFVTNTWSWLMGLQAGLITLGVTALIWKGQLKMENQSPVGSN